MESACGVGYRIVPSWTVSGVAARAYASDLAGFCALCVEVGMPPSRRGVDADALWTQ